MVEARGLSKRFRAQYAVRDLSLAIPHGRVFGLVGPNGSGKTTLISLKLGLIRPSAGLASLFGRADGPDGRALRRVGATVETPAFYSYLSGRENLQFFQGHHQAWGAGAGRCAARASESYCTCTESVPHLLPRNEAAPCDCVRAAGEPDLVFLDEPTNGLDPAGVVEIPELVRGLGTQGRTVVLSSHLLHEVEQVCDRIAVLVHAEVVVAGRVDELLTTTGRLHLKLTVCWSR